MENNGNILLIDPNDVNRNININNSIPNYENMFLFVELTAERRGRSTLVTSSDGNYILDKNDLNKNIFINMLGFDQKKSYHTTNYYKGSVPDNEILFEGFGMTSIKIVTNSSFIPQVTIEFVDNRGVSFFEQENSPYRIIFDFPPPIFTLTVKGYYGRSLTYELHLVNHKEKFNAKTGNFTISADFIAMTFAPLTDILFKYIINFSKMKKNENINSNIANPPTSTYELINKIENLYDNLNETVQALDENKKYENSQQKINNLNNFFDAVRIFKSEQNISVPDSYRNVNNLVYLIYDPDKINDIGYGNLYEIKNITNYDELLKNTENDSFVDANKKFYLAIKTKQKQQNVYPIISDDTSNNFTNLSLKTDIDNELFLSLSNIKKDLIATASSLITNLNDNDIKEPENLPLGGSMNNNDNYVGIDISNLYQKLFKEKISQFKIKSDSQKELLQKVNTIVEGQLGMKPTIYNIFKIICDDIDYFFDKIRQTSIDAEEHHEKFKELILGSNIKDNTEKIYPFPLFIEEKTENCVKTQSRTYPLDISKQLGSGNEFPELKLIEDFIQTFLEIQKDELVKSMRIKEDSQGNIKWIPIASLDSKLSNINKNSPYYGIDDNVINENSGGGNNKIFEILLNRFYVLSQDIYYNDFYDNKKSNDIIEYYASAEAVNIASSLKNKNFVDNILTQIQKYKNDITSFYNYLNNLNTVRNTTANINLENTNYYINKYDENYIPVSIIQYSDIKLRTDNEDNDTPVGNFMQTIIPKGIDKLFNISGKNNLYNFTTDNLLIINDSNVNGKEYESRYLLDLNNTNSLASKQNFILLWSVALEFNDKIFINILNDPLNIDFSILLISSTFGSSLSPFTDINKINSIVFNTPALIDVPYYIILYISSIIKLVQSKNSTIESEKKMYNEYLNYYDKKLFFTYIIQFDINYFENYFSENDKNIFLSNYNEFIQTNGLFYDIKEVLNQIYNQKTTDSNYYNDALSNKYYENFTKKLIQKYIITNYNQSIFSKKKKNEIKKYYTSLNILNTSSDNKQINDNFFTIFFNKLNSELLKQKDNVKNIENEFKKSVDDDNIWNQTYYSFKNISDKWISGLNKNISGYPFNENGETLISKFAFVDRAMNPIGDIIINPEELLDMKNDLDINVFTVMSRLLSKNGFEFFPLQNFMSFSNDSWNNTFKIYSTDESISKDNVSAFYVCMYIGGTSKYLTNTRNGFVNDGIVDLTTEELPDFNSEECAKLPVEKGGGDNQEIDKNNYKLNFPYRQVRAFRIRFGEQNQSFFTDINIDSKEYPETNESLAILSRIAGDNKKQSPIPKGQNLYNIYENRSYRAQIEMLGNMMIQPTQYFQLENIPMYSGAYIILDVEHNISSSNFMTTKFNGVKILKYPIPLNRESAVIAGIDTGSSDNTNNATTTSNNIFAAVTPENAPPEAQYNSMYELLI